MKEHFIVCGLVLSPPGYSELGIDMPYATDHLAVRMDGGDTGQVNEWHHAVPGTTAAHSGESGK